MSEFIGDNKQIKLSPTEVKLLLNTLYGKRATSKNSSFKVAHIKHDKSICFYIVPSFDEVVAVSDFIKEVTK